MCLGFVEWRLEIESTEFVYKKTQGPNVRIRVIRLLLHKLRRYVVWSLSKIDECMQESDLGSNVPQHRCLRNSSVRVLLKSQSTEFNGVILIEKY